jgi:hypothetical protein
MILFSLGVVCGFLAAAVLIAFMRRPLVIHPPRPTLPAQWRPPDAA